MEIFFGESVQSYSSKTVQFSLALTACRKLGVLNGPVYFQLKYIDDMPYIIEVAPRLDGCHMWNILEKCTGINLIKLTINHLINNDVNELEKAVDGIKKMELVFWCQEPKTIIDNSKLELPEDAIDSFYYYEDGEVVRPINGRFEKVGYYIRPKDEEK